MKITKPNFKVLFDNDKFLWFLSFLFAFMLWFTVVNTIDTSADRSITNVPVSFESSSESLEAMGLDVVLEIEVQGAKKVMAKCPEAVSVFILPPSFGVLEKRLRRRATDSEEAVQKRLAAARGEILQAADYDYMVVNDALEDCVSDLEAVLQGEKCRSARAGNLIEEVLKNE